MIPMPKACRRAARVAAVFFAAILLFAWAWLCDAWVDGLLDYPLRRADENADYPPLHTLPFYWKCIRELGSYFLFTSWIWLIPFSIALISLFFGLGIRSNRWRFVISLTALLGPIIAHAVYWMFIVY